MRDRTRFAAVAAALILASGALTACDSGRTRPPQVNVQVVHAAAERDQLTFLRGRRDETTLSFREASSTLRFDADEYRFTALVTEPGAREEIGSFSLELVPETDYLFVLTEAHGVLEPIVVESPAATATSGSDSRIVAVHAAPSLESMAVYVERTGTDPSTATALGALSFGGTIEDATRAAGDYRLVLTAANDPADVLLTSAEFALEAGRTYGFVIVDPADDSVAPISVVSLGTAAAVLVDESVGARAHVLNAATDQAPRDAYIDEDLSAPFVAEAPYLTTVTADIPFGEQTLSITPAGNTGVVEAEIEPLFARTRHYTVLITGDPGEIEVMASLYDPRRLANHARLRFLNAATRYKPLEVYVVPPGGDIEGLPPTFLMSVPAISARLDLAIDDYELIMRDPETKTIVAGPVPVSLAEGVYTVLFVNGAAPETVDLIYLEDFE